MARKQYGVAASAAADLVTRTDASKVPPLKNYLLNGACMIAQEFGSTAQTGVTTALRYPIDGVAYGTLGAPTAVFTLQQVALNTPGGSPNRLRATITTAQASMAVGDTILIEPGRLDGLDIADLLMGSANAKTFVVRFGFKGPAGTYGFHLRNAARGYVAAFTISAGQANTDTLQSFVIPGDTTGTWLNTEGTLGVAIMIALASGTTNQTSTLNAWGTVGPLAPNTITNNVAVNGSVFELFDIGMYLGSNVPDFVVPDPAVEKLRCQRYFQAYPGGGATVPTTLLQTPGTVPAAGNMSFDYFFPVPMRATPTITLANTILTNAGTPTVGAGGSNNTKVRFNVSITAGSTTGAQAVFTWTASARP